MARSATDLSRSSRRLRTPATTVAQPSGGSAVSSAGSVAMKASARRSSSSAPYSPDWIWNSATVCRTSSKAAACTM